MKSIYASSDLYCSIECSLDRYCEEWTFVGSEISQKEDDTKSEDGLTVKSAKVPSSILEKIKKRSQLAVKSKTCYLQDDNFVKIKQHLNVSDDLFSSSLFSISRGTKSSSNAFVDRLIQHPLAIGRSSNVNFQRNFVHGCQYTIMLWVWLWKGHGKIDALKAVFSSHESLPVYSQHQNILPTLIFNLKRSPRVFFYATSKDASNDYVGYWGTHKLKYGEWIHLTFAVTATSVIGFVNGIREGDGSRMNLPPADHCPFNWSFNHINNLNIPNNTILRVGGIQRGMSIPMIVEGLTVYNGVFLNSRQIALHMAQHPHSEFPTLYKLMKEEEEVPYILSAKNIYENEYAQYAIGLCPVSVCGKFCLNGYYFDNFDVNFDFNNIEFKKSVEWMVRQVDFRRRLDKPEKVQSQNQALISTTLNNLWNASDTLVLKTFDDVELNEESDPMAIIHKIEDLLLSSQNTQLNSNSQLEPFVANDHFQKVTSILNKYNSAMKSLLGIQEVAIAASVGSESSEEGFEFAVSSLFYSLWKYDDFELEYDVFMERDKSKKMTSMGGQPTRIALGNSFNRVISPHNINYGNVDLIFAKLGIQKARSITPSLPASVNMTEILELVYDAKETNSTILPSLLSYFNSKFNSSEENLIVSPSNSELTIFNGAYECVAELSYLFPVAQSVIMNYGVPESGVTLIEDIRLADISSSFDPINRIKNIAGSGLTTPTANVGYQNNQHNMVTDETRNHFEAEAANGNADAQVWLGVKNYWGVGGFRENATRAREYFEKAASRNHTEALYCLGALYDNGQGGLPLNKTKALELFVRAANATVPYPPALQAVGLFYQHGQKKNMTLAIHYYEKAAEMGNANAYYSLSMIYRDRFPYIEKGMTLTMHLLAQAISKGNIRAISMLGHAFIDSESWLGHYEREIHYKRLKNENLSSPYDSEIDELLYKWGYNETEGTHIVLPGRANVVIKVNPPFGPNCDIAAPLIRYIVDHNYRSNDLMKNALNSFVSGDLYKSLEYYDEAADLGVAAAQENSIFLYNLLQLDECIENKEAGEGGALLTNVLKAFDIFENFLDSTNYVFDELKNRSLNCTDFVGRVTARRLLQLVSSGDLHAIRVVANMMYAGKFPFERNVTGAALLYARGAEEFGDVECYLNLGWIIQKGESADLLRNVTAALELYRRAAELEQVYNKFGNKWATTLGIAPALARASTIVDFIQDPTAMERVQQYIVQSFPLQPPSISLPTLVLDDNTVLTILTSSFLIVLTWWIFRRRRGRVQQEIGTL